MGELISIVQYVKFVGTGARNKVLKVLEESKTQVEARNNLIEKLKLTTTEAYIVVQNFSKHINTKNNENQK